MQQMYLLVETRYSNIHNVHNVPQRKNPGCISFWQNGNISDIMDALELDFNNMLNRFSTSNRD